MTLPTWTLDAPYSRVEAAWHDGRISDAAWQAYRAIWRYSAPRFTATVNLPSVREIHRHLDTGEPITPYTIELEA